METETSPPVGHVRPMVVTVHPSDTAASARLWAAAAGVQLLAPALAAAVTLPALLGAVPPGTLLPVVLGTVVVGLLAPRALEAIAWQRLEATLPSTSTECLRVADLTARSTPPVAQKAGAAMLVGCALLLVAVVA